MTKISKRRIVATVIDMAALSCGYLVAELWGIAAVFAYGIWSFYDGITRIDLHLKSLKEITK